MNFAAARSWASQQLHERSESPQLDAEILLCHVLGIERVSLYTHPEQTVAPPQLQELERLIAQRRDGYPIAYQLHHQEFWSMQLKVSPDVLIPRSETELLVELALQRIPADQPCKVLELGTGSGAIALAIAKERPAAAIVATDISAPALEIAQHNATAHDIHTIEFVASDWFTAVEHRGFDLIVSNPPYIAAADPDLARGVARYEPELALLAAHHGLAALTTIISNASRYLQNRGQLLLEHGWQQHQAVSDLLQLQGFVDIYTHPDLAGHPRVTTGVSAHG